MKVKLSGNKQSMPNNLEKCLGYIALSLIIAFVVIVRINLLGIPFERDEGCYGYFGQLILDGATPYVSFYEQKPPGLYYAYALIIMLFGNTIEGLHTGFLILNVFTVVFLYFIGKRLFDNFAGLIVAGSYAVLSLAIPVSGFTTQSEHLIALFATAGLLVMLKGFKSEKLLYIFLSGVLVSLASSIKQSGVFFVLFSALAVIAYYLLNKPVNRKMLLKNFIVYSAGVSSVYALACLVLILQGAFAEFWFWCYEFPKVYVSELTLSEGMKWFYREFKDIVLGNHLFFWITGGLGGVLIVFTRTAKYKKIIICLFALFSSLTIVPGLYFTGHYWIQLLPALCLLIGVSFYFVKELLSKFVNSKVAVSVVFGVFVIVVGRDITNQREYYFNPDYTKILRQLYNGNPFPESKVIADFIKERTTKADSIVLIGSEPQVYFYTDRRCPSRHSYFAYLVFGHPKHVVWQKEFISDVEKAMPKYMVFFFNRLSLMGDPDADKTIYTWFLAFAGEHYRVVGIADMTSSGTVYVWNEDLEGYRPKGLYKILIYERK